MAGIALKVCIVMAYTVVAYVAKAGIPFKVGIPSVEKATDSVSTIVPFLENFGPMCTL